LNLFAFPTIFSVCVLDIVSKKLLESSVGATVIAETTPEASFKNVVEFRYCPAVKDAGEQVCVRAQPMAAI
jgi:hypothetical protein